MPGRPFNFRNSRSAKLTAQQVLEIRHKYSLGWTQSSLAREYHLSVGQIGRIVREESWQQPQLTVPGATEPSPSATPPPGIAEDQAAESARRLADFLVKPLEVTQIPEDQITILRRVKEATESAREGDKLLDQFLTNDDDADKPEDPSK